MRYVIAGLLGCIFAFGIVGAPIAAWHLWRQAPRGVLNAIERHILDTGVFPEPCDAEWSPQGHWVADCHLPAGHDGDHEVYIQWGWREECSGTLWPSRATEEFDGVQV